MELDETILGESFGLPADRMEPEITESYECNGCRSGIYNGVNILQTHCRWYVTHWFFLNEIERGRARIPVKCKSLNHAQNRRSYPHDIIS